MKTKKELICTKAKGETFEEADARNNHFKEAGKAEAEKELYPCSKCRRETSHKFCIECIAKEIEKERESILKMIYKEMENLKESKNDDAVLMDMKAGASAVLKGLIQKIGEMK